MAPTRSDAALAGVATAINPAMAVTIATSTAVIREVIEKPLI